MKSDDSKPLDPSILVQAFTDYILIEEALVNDAGRKACGCESCKTNSLELNTTNCSWYKEIVGKYTSSIGTPKRVPNLNKVTKELAMPGENNNAAPQEPSNGQPVVIATTTGSKVLKILGYGATALIGVGVGMLIGKRSAAKASEQMPNQ